MESLFVYYNPNPLYKAPKAGKPQKKWRIGDCAVRAICKATDMCWLSAYRFASDSALKVFEPFNCSFGFAQVMKDLDNINSEADLSKAHKNTQKYMTIYEFFSLMGGVGLFLYGMSIMSSGLKNAAGSKLKGILEKATRNRFMAVFIGISVTLLI